MNRRWGFLIKLNISSEKTEIIFRPPIQTADSFMYRDCNRIQVSMLTQPRYSKKILMVFTYPGGEFVVATKYKFDYNKK